MAGHCLPTSQQLSVTLMKFDDGLIVHLWRFAATYVHAKHIRAEMPNSNNFQLISVPEAFSKRYHFISYIIEEEPRLGTHPNGDLETFVRDVICVSGPVLVKR